MADDPNVTGGTAGEPVAPAAASSQSDADLLATLEPSKPATSPEADAEFTKKLESMDPGALPESVRRKLEAPFLSNFNKKTTELDQERQGLLRVIERLTTRNGDVTPTVDEKKQLLEKIAEGDMTVVGDLVDRLVAERTGPQMDMLAKTNAIREAAEMMPELPKYEAQVAEGLKQDPDLIRLATIDNRRYASRVLAALAWRQHAIALQEELTKTKAAAEASKKQAVEDYKKQLAGLPSTTSRAGATQGTPAEKPPSLREAMEIAYAEAGGS